jgi:molybdopterin-guanine dinucleotide biosynthesis protein A
VNRRTTGAAISATSSIAGYVVAGGGSTRFGQDKARAELGGKPMLRKMCGLIGDTVGSVSVVAPRHRYDDLDVWITEDLWPGQGPLGGIVTALLATGETDGGRDWNLIVSCDMPFLTREWLTYLIGRAIESSAQVVVPKSDYGLEPLCTCWRTDVVAELESALERGVRKVTEGISLLRAEVLDERDWKRFDSAGRLFWNMNTAADYEEARRIVEAEQS